jgi:hypothetical protein
MKIAVRHGTDFTESKGQRQRLSASGSGKNRAVA